MSRATFFFVAVLAAVAIAATSVPAASADNCSNNGGFVTCTYLDAQALGPFALVTGSAWNYWKTSRMWRPANLCAQVGYYNGSFIMTQYCGPNTVLSLNGPYGYSVGACYNVTDQFVAPVTCKVFNWYA